VFSERFPPSEKNALTLLLEEKKRLGCDILDLSESNPTKAGFSYPKDEILASLAQPESLLYHPEPRGLLMARSAVRDYYGQRGHGIPLDDIFLTSSTSEAYSYLLKILTDPGDQIHIPAPSYPLLEYLAVCESVLCRQYGLQYDGQWRIDFDSLENAISGESKAVLCVHPNNPTGSFVGTDEWETLTSIAASSNLAVICDEVFSDYPLLDGSIADPLVEGKTLVCVLSGLSKVVALPQVKLSWIVLRGPEPMKSKAREKLEFVADTYLSVSAMVQHALPQLLANRSYIQGQIKIRLKRNLDNLRGLTKDSALDILPPEGGWYAVVRLPRIKTDEEWSTELLAGKNTLAHPGFFFDFAEPSCVVLSLLPLEATFGQGVEHLLDLVTQR
jgi:aspartate/methionine/tyrosine aminotransferase